MRPDQSKGWQLFYFILSSYLFKMVIALLDTIPFYYGTSFLRRYLQVEDEIEGVRIGIWLERAWYGLENNDLLL